GDLEPVFDAMLENAIRTCGATFGNLFLREGDAFRVVAMQGPVSSYVEWYRQDPLIALKDIPHTPLWRLEQTKQIEEIPDLREDPGYLERNPRLVGMVEAAGARTSIGVPMLKDDELVGAFFLYRSEIRPFTNKQLDLVQNFAAQAVIAIENTRLLNELRARTDQLARSVEELRALGEVTQAVNSTLEVQTVLDTIVAKATQLSGTEAG